METVKKIKAFLLASFQHIAEFVSILIFITFLVIFIIDISKITFEFFQSHGDGQQNHSAGEFVKNTLTSFELLFVAPIPILIVFAFKTIMVKIFPTQFDETEFDPKNLLRLDLAKKTFISSIIGILSTFILSIFLQNNNFDEYEVKKVLLFLGFLIILIIYYKILSAHAED
mgnify:CR=1 FL=1